MVFFFVWVLFYLVVEEVRFGGVFPWIYLFFFFCRGVLNVSRYLLCVQVDTLYFFFWVARLKSWSFFFLLYLLGRREAENGVDERRHDIEYVSGSKAN